MTKNEKIDVEVVRGDGKKKREEFAYCKWAAQAWEAEYYANTPAHRKSIDRTIGVMVNDPCWYSTMKRLKTDTRKMQRKIEGNKKPRAKKQESEG